MPAAAKATWARRPASGCRKRTLRRRFCRQLKHEVGRQLNVVEVGRSSRLPARPEPVMLLHITSVEKVHN